MTESPVQTESQRFRVNDLEVDLDRMSVRRVGQELELPDLSFRLLAALVRAESGFDPRAVSSAGARGLGQLMPATARELGVSKIFDPTQNLEGAARYLSRQLDRFGRVDIALAAYHAGPRRAARGLSGVPAVTRTYVARVLRFEREYRVRALP